MDMTSTRSEQNDRTRRASRHATWLLAGVLGLASCASPPEPASIPIPATGSLRGAAELLVGQVEQVEGTPEWAHHRRVEGDRVYGVGVEARGTSAEQALYRALRKANASVANWLDGQGVRARSPRALNDRLAVPEERIEFERMAHDEIANRWYVLARFDLAAARGDLHARIAETNVALSRSEARLLDEEQENDERIRAALALIFSLDRRQQYEMAVRALRGEGSEVPDGLDSRVLQEEADNYLSQHGVRILTQGLEVPGLESGIESTLSEVYLQRDAFGRGLISVRLEESQAFERSNRYLEIDGRVEVAIEGGDARTYSTPFHVVSTGADLEEARFRAARTVHLEVARILRETFRAMADSDV
jgi:hypothetical protein